MDWEIRRDKDGFLCDYKISHCKLTAGYYCCENDNNNIEKLEEVYCQKCKEKVPKFILLQLSLLDVQ